MPVISEPARQFLRYCVVGAFNFLLNAAIFNGFLYASGITRGPWVPAFAFITFAIVTTQSFFTNMLWTFRGTPAQDRRRQYVRFFLVAGASAIVSVALIDFLVNELGSPAGISPTLWANIALLATVAVSVAGNFFGFKFFVFTK